MVISYLCLLGSALVAAVSQIMLKTASGKSYANKVKEYANWTVICAYMLFALSLVLSVLGMRDVDLTLSVLINASSYIFVALLSWLMLKEKINLQKGIGLAVIIVGIAVASIVV